MKTTFKLTGFAELDAMLKQLGGTIARRLGQQAVLAGARPIAKAAKAIVPVETGALRQSIKPLSRKVRRTSLRAAVVTVQGREAALAHLIEFGTQPHPIVARKGKVLRTAAGVVLGKRVQHPGIQGRGFMRRAAESQSGAAVEKIREILARGIPREASKLAKTGPKMRNRP